MAEMGVVVAGRKHWGHRGERNNRGVEGKAERFPKRGLVLTSTHHPERLVGSPARTGGSWGLMLGLRSDPRERTGVGSMNTA